MYLCNTIEMIDLSHFLLNFSTWCRSSKAQIQNNPNYSLLLLSSFSFIFFLHYDPTLSTTISTTNFDSLTFIFNLKQNLIANFDNLTFAFDPIQNSIANQNPYWPDTTARLRLNPHRIGQLRLDPLAFNPKPNLLASIRGRRSTLTNPWNWLLKSKSESKLLELINFIMLINFIISTQALS